MQKIFCVAFTSSDGFAALADWYFVFLKRVVQIRHHSYCCELGRGLDQPYVKGHFDGEFGRQYETESILYNGPVNSDQY